MKIQRHKIRLPVRNFDFNEGLKKNCRHNELLPDNFRSLFVGGSNCGKTNLLMTLLTHPNGLKFLNVYLFSPSTHQAKYRLLKKILSRVEGLNFYEYNDRILELEEIKPNSLCIFDDTLKLTQKQIKDIFARGRHFGIECIFLAQSYSMIAKQMIRDNANFIVLFKIDIRNLKHAYNDHVIGDFSFEVFRKMCGKCWNVKYGFLCINKECDLNKGRYRCGLDNYIMTDSDSF